VTALDRADPDPRLAVHLQVGPVALEPRNFVLVHQQGLWMTFCRLLRLLRLLFILLVVFLAIFLSIEVNKIID
jgi:hypothetical protein